jgi:hypothetical protein
MNSKTAMRFDLGFEVTAIEQLAFECGKEALANSIVEAIAQRTHKRSKYTG